MSRRRRREEELPGMVVAILLVASVAGNLAAGALVNHAIVQSFAAKTPRLDHVMEVALVEPEEGARAEPDELVPENLAELDRVVDESPPPDAEHVAEFDNDVDQETWRAGGPRDKQASASAPEQTPQRRRNPKSRPPTPADADRQGQHQGQGSGAASGQGSAGEGPERDALSLRPADGRMANGAGRELGAAGAAGMGGRELGGSSELMRRTFGSPGSIDRPKDAAEGDENLIKTNRHRFASFFNRVRAAVADNWRPNQVLRARDPYGKIYGKRDRTTHLRMRVRRDGSLERVWILQSCGVDALDEEAVRAVRAAAPFTNPPQELFEGASPAFEFNFGFLVYYEGAPQIFRMGQ